MLLFLIWHLKSCIFNVVLHSLETHSDCTSMWASGLLAQAVMSQPGQPQLVERTTRAVSFQRDYFVLGGFLRLRSLKWLWQIGLSFRLLGDQSLSPSNTHRTSPLLFDMVKHKPSVPLLTRFQCAHLLGVIFILFNGWTNRHREVPVHDWTKVIGSQDGNPVLSPGSALFSVVYWVLKKDPWHNHLGQPLLFEMKTFRCKEINWLVQNQTQSLAQQCRSPNGQNEVVSCQNKDEKKSAIKSHSLGNLSEFQSSWW